MDGWASDRIAFGSWVTPADEVAQHANPHAVPLLHTPVADIAQQLYHPFSASSDKPDSEEGEPMGYIAPREASNVKLFLPPQDLLIELNNLYADKLQGVLWAPFREILSALLELADGDKEQAEKTATNLSVDDLLKFLKEEATWYKGGLAMVYRRKKGLPVRQPSEDGSNTISNDPTTRLTYRAKKNDKHEVDEYDNDGSGEGLEYYDQEEEYDSGSDAAESIRIEHYEEDDDDMKTGLNVYGIEEVMPSSPQSATGEDDEEREESVVSMTSTKPTLANELTPQTVIMTRTPDTWLGKRKEAPEGLENGKYSKERKSQSLKSVSHIVEIASLADFRT